MDWFLENYDLVYLILISLLLILSWYFFQKSQYDERRKNRFSRNTIRQYKAIYKSKLYNAEFEQVLRKNGLPQWVTSERVNLIRFGIVIVLLVIISIQLLTKTQYISLSDLMMWGILPILLTPKKPFPFYYLIQSYRKGYSNDVSNEVYQLYNEIKANFQIKGGDVHNSYYTIQSALPYYKKIRVTLEKMLPYLEKKKLDEAWQLFSTELDTKEAHMLSVIMKEVESMQNEQALVLLEQKRQEFSNHLYNRYTEKLRKRKSIIFMLVVLGAMTVFVNEVTVFFMWYKEVMTVVNQFN